LSKSDFRRFAIAFESKRFHSALIPKGPEVCGEGLGFDKIRSRPLLYRGYGKVVFSMEPKRIFTQEIPEPWARTLRGAGKRRRALRPGRSRVARGVCGGLCRNSVQSAP